MILRCRLTCVFWLVTLWATAPTRAQPPPSAIPEGQKDDDAPNVYVGDSMEAASALREAERLAKAERWDEAAQAYRRAREAHGDKLVRVAPRDYLGVVAFINQRLSQWPAQALTRYRLLVAGEAEQRLRVARSRRDLSCLLAVYEEQFCTKQGAEAGDLAAQIAMEAGRFDLAIRIYDALLAAHPDRKASAGAWRAKLALAHTWAGNDALAKPLLDKIRTEHAEEELTWAGRKEPLWKIVAQLRSTLRRPTTQPRSVTWPMIRGSVDRSDIAEGGLPASAPLWEYGPKHGFDPLGKGQDRPSRLTQGGQVVLRGPLQVRSRRGHSREIGRGPSIVPVCDREALYFTDGLSVWGLRATNGSEVWPAYEAPHVDSLRLATPSRRQPPDLHACVLHGDRLYAVLGQSEFTFRRGSPHTVGQLVCLDTRSGKPIWSLRLDEVDPKLEDVRLDSAPVPHGDKLFAVARRRKRFGFEDCYLLRIDAETRRLDWMRYLASASVSSYGVGRQTQTFPAIQGETVYVCTNLGAVAAVSAPTGRVRWLRVYHEDRTEEMEGLRYSRRLPSWRFDAPICWGRRVVCAPLDSEKLLVLDAERGQIVVEIELGRLGHMQQVLGVLHDVLYVAGRELVAWDLKENDPKWSRSLVEYGGLLGRGQLTRSHVYLPAGDGIVRFALGGGSPEVYEWSPLGEGANLLVRPEIVVAAGEDRIIGYAPKDEAFARLQRRIEAAPSDPEPRLDLAEVAYRVGERSRAVAELTRAIEVCGGFARISDPKLKRRIFEDFIEFGDRALADQPPDPPFALKLYEQAAQCPPDPQGQVIYRLRIARASMALQKIERAIEQFQQIIADGGLRSQRVFPLEVEESWPAGRWAEARVREILAEYGRQPYAAFEKRAEAMLAVGREQNDVEIIQRVIEGYPNSLAARKALVVKARILEGRGQPRQAVRAYLDLLTRDPNTPEAPVLLRHIAAAYLKAERPRSARRWLARGARLFPEARFRKQEETMGFAEMAHRIAKEADYGPPLPKFSVPVTTHWKREFPGWVALLPPRNAELPDTRWDFYVTYSNGRVEAFSAPGNQPLWSAPLDCEERPQLLGMAQDRLLLANRRKLLCVDIPSGRTLWFAEAFAKEQDRAEVDPEDIARWEYWAMSEDRVYCASSDAEVVCYDLRTGKEIWRERLLAKLRDAPLVSDDFFLYEVRAHGNAKSSLHVLDAESGRTVRKIELASAVHSTWMTMSDVGLVVRATTRRLTTIDPFTGEQAWAEGLELPNVRASFLVGPESLFVSNDGLTVVRRDLETGKAIAQSPSIPGATRGDVYPRLDGNRLFVRTSEVIAALDRETMDLRWRGITDHAGTLSFHQIGQPFIVGVDGWHDPEGRRPGRRYVAYFYDRRSDSGIIPPGGRVDLGYYEHGRNLQFADHTILIADGNTIHGWSSSDE